MEQELDFDYWLANYKPPELVYMAEFDPITGQVSSVGPSHAFLNSKHTLVIDREIAELIIEGKIKISDCVIDLDSNTLEMTELKNIFKIDDVLHRIISKEWTKIEKPDIYITYESSSNEMIFELSEEYGGTKNIDSNIKSRSFRWDGDTILNFLVTDYNDPNILYEMISIKISDLLGTQVIIKDIEVPSRFSVYTRRVFRNYVIEYR